MGISTQETGYALSKRELEILKLVAEGRSNKEIACLLAISAETVKTHMKNVMKKMGASTRIEAVVRAVKNGLLTHASPL